MRIYGERKTTRIMMATVPHVTAWAGRTKLWWQLYRTSLPERGVRNITPMDFCWSECTRNIFSSWQTGKESAASFRSRNVTTAFPNNLSAEYSPINNTIYNFTTQPPCDTLHVIWSFLSLKLAQNPLQCSPNYFTTGSKMKSHGTWGRCPPRHIFVYWR